MELTVSGMNSGEQPVLGFNYGGSNTPREGAIASLSVRHQYNVLAWLDLLRFPEPLMRVSPPTRVIAAAAGAAHLLLRLLLHVLQFAGHPSSSPLGFARFAVFFSRCAGGHCRPSDAAAARLGLAYRAYSSPSRSPTFWRPACFRPCIHRYRIWKHPKTA